MLVESGTMVSTQTAPEELQDMWTDGCLVTTSTDIPHAESATDPILLLTVVLKSWKKLVWSFCYFIFSGTGSGHAAV